MATASVLTREGNLASFDGTQLFWRAWEVASPKGTFAVIHGLGEHSGRYRRFAEAMADRGFSTFAVDLRGMGSSQGARGCVNRWSDWVQDASAFVNMVQGHATAADLVPLGHSFGGVVLLSAVIGKAVESTRFVVSNPALRPMVKVPAWKLLLGRATSRALPRLTLSNEVDPGLISRDRAVVDDYRSDPLVHDKISTRLFTEWAAACQAVFADAAGIHTPFLLILSEADRLIDPEGGRHLAQLAAQAPAVTRQYPGRYHEPFNDRDANQVFDDLAAWMATPPPATASRATS